MFSWNHFQTYVYRGEYILNIGGGGRIMLQKHYKKLDNCVFAPYKNDGVPLFSHYKKLGPPCNEIVTDASFHTLSKL